MGIAAILSLFAPALSAGTFRWVDENGSVHYTDQVPPEDAKRPRAKLNPQAKILEFIEGQKTPEQLDQARRLKKLRIDQQRILAKQRDSDISLHQTYRSEEEMQAVLQGKLDTIESAQKIADANRMHQEEILRTLIKHAAETENAGQPVPQNLRDSLESTRRQIASYLEKSRALDSTKADIVNAFAKDLERLKNLENRRHLNPESGTLEWKAQRPEADVAIVSAVNCTPDQCDAAWLWRKNTSRPIAIDPC